MLFVEVVAVYYENRTERIHTRCWETTEFSNFKTCGVDYALRGKLNSLINASVHRLILTFTDPKKSGYCE